MRQIRFWSCCALGLWLATGGLCPAWAATAPAPAAPPPDSLTLYFDSGSTQIRPADLRLLDQASRLYRDGHPIVMVLSASTDTVGGAEVNLRIAEARANAVLRGLVARGIPASRFELLAKGESELPVQTGPDIAEPRNRQVSISWR